MMDYGSNTVNQESNKNIKGLACLAKISVRNSYENIQDHESVSVYACISFISFVFEQELAEGQGNKMIIKLAFIFSSICVNHVFY